MIATFLFEAGNSSTPLCGMRLTSKLAPPSVSMSTPSSSNSLLSLFTERSLAFGSAVLGIVGFFVLLIF